MWLGAAHAVGADHEPGAQGVAVAEPERAGGLVDGQQDLQFFGPGQFRYLAADGLQHQRPGDAPIVDTEGAEDLAIQL